MESTLNSTENVIFKAMADFDLPTQKLLLLTDVKLKTKLKEI